MGSGASRKRSESAIDDPCTGTDDVKIPPPPPPPPEFIAAVSSTQGDGRPQSPSAIRHEPSRSSDFFQKGRSSVNPSDETIDQITGDVTPSGETASRRISVDYRSFLPERFEVDVAQRYALDKLALGEGGYGQVFVARDREVEDRIVVVKKITKSGDRARSEAFYSEVMLMKDLDHPNICKLLEFYEQGRNAYFVMEYCEGGEVFSRIIENQYIDEEMSASIILQVASALRYAHGRKIAHRDIKPENIVFCSRSANDQTVKVIDWGLGICFKDEVMRTAVGSFTYAAPEVVCSNENNSYTDMCDLWSLGVVTYVMLCGKPPFWGAQRDHLRRARAEQYPLDRPPWDTISDSAKDFVRKLLKAVPTERMPIDAVAAHPWLNCSSYGQLASCTEFTQVLTNLKQFSNTSRFQAMCVAAVARQLDHRCLRRIHRVFREMDMKGDGVLHFQEVADGFKRIFGEQSKEFREVQQTFEQMDLDGSGTIDYTEFCAAGMGQYAIMQDDAVWAAFKSFDIDDSGVITKDNLEKVLAHAGVLKAWSKDVCQEVAQEMMNRFDTNGSDAIEYSAWKEILQRCWQEQTMLADEDDIGEQPQLQPDLSTRSVLSNGEPRHDNKVVWAYEVLNEVTGLHTVDEDATFTASGP